MPFRTDTRPTPFTGWSELAALVETFEHAHNPTGPQARAAKILSEEIQQQALLFVRAASAKHTP